MFKNSITSHLEKDGRHYFFCFEPEAPLGELHDVLCTMKEQVVLQLLKQHDEDMKPKNSEVVDE